MRCNSPPDFVIAISTQIRGTTKNRTKTVSTTVAIPRRLQPRGRSTARRERPIRTASDDAESESVHASSVSNRPPRQTKTADSARAHDQQQDGDGRRPVEVPLVEGVLVRELVERIVVGHLAVAGLREHRRLDEELGAGGQRQHRHVGDPFAQHRQLDLQRQSGRGRRRRSARPPSPRREMLFSAPYMTTIQPPAPAQNAIRAKTTGRPSGAMVAEKLSKPSSWSNGANGLAAGFEHEQPEQHAGRAGQCPRQVVDQPQGAAQPAHRDCMHHQRQQHDEHQQRDQPECDEQRHVHDRGREPEVVQSPG